MRGLPTGAGVAAALGLMLSALAFCFWPVAGRPAEAWLPVAFRFVTRRVRGRNRTISGAAQSGSRVRNGRPEPIPFPPIAGKGLELLAVPLRGETIGVFKDRPVRTYTAA